MARARIIIVIVLIGGLLAACGRKAEAPTRAPALAPQIAATPGAAPLASATLKAIRARGRVNCGVPTDLAGFAERDVLGQWKGFDVDMCRAVAAAVLKDARAVRIVPLTARTRFTALQAGQVDLLARAGAWTYTRDAGLGLDFAGISYYDAQGFLAPIALNLKSAADFGERRICVEAGTTSELNLLEYLRGSASKAKSVVADSLEEAIAAYQDGRCEILSANRSTLAAILSNLRRADENIILPDAISKEPMGPVVRQGDDVWTDVVRWTLNAMILAEEMQLTSHDIEEAREAPATPEIGRLLSGDGYGAMLTLPDDWAYQVIRQVGGYGEVFSRNLGPETPLKLARGLNAPWNAQPSGLLYAPPVR